MSLSERALRRKWGEEDAEARAREYERRPMPPAPTADIFPTRYHCTSCKRETDGRFTKRKTASGDGWDQGLQQPIWYCWTCLPKGEGRGE